MRAVDVWHYPTSAGLPPGKTPEPITAEVEQRLRTELAEAVAKANSDPSARIETKLVYGHPAQALIDESRGQSRLVVGHRATAASPRCSPARSPCTASTTRPAPSWWSAADRTGQPGVTGTRVGRSRSGGTQHDH